MEQEKDRKKSVGTVVGLIIGFAVIVLVKQFAFKTPSFDKAMMQAASELNKSCPIMVDTETQLDNSVALPNNIFQYNYTLINMKKDSVDIAVFEEYMQPMILNNVKTNPDLKTYRNNKVTMAYYYKDMDGLFLTKISVTPDQYLK